MNKKRQAFQDLVLENLAIGNPSGENAERYKEQWAAMTDAEFDAWVEDLRHDRTKLALYTPNMAVTVTNKNLTDMASNLNLKLFERLRIWDSVNRRYYLTPETYLVVELPVRRLKQYLIDKRSIPEGDQVVNPTTGQVIKPDKGASISQTEAQTYDSKGLHACLDELLIVRGGNLEAYGSYKAMLEQTGQARLSELDFSAGVRSAIVAQVTLESMHIENNLADIKD